MQLDYNKTISELNNIYKSLDLKTTQYMEYIIQCEDKLKTINNNNDELYNKITNKIKDKETLLYKLSDEMDIIKKIINSLNINNYNINYNLTIDKCLEIYEYYSNLFNEYSNLFERLGNIKKYLENNNLKSDENYKTVCYYYILINDSLSLYFDMITMFDELINYYIYEGSKNENNLTL